jgi:hypothetical protein
MIGGQQPEYGQLYKRRQAARHTEAEKTGGITEEEVKELADKATATTPNPF